MLLESRKRRKRDRQLDRRTEIDGKGVVGGREGGVSLKDLRRKRRE